MLLIGLAWCFPTLALGASAHGEGQLPLSGGSDGKSRLSQGPVPKRTPPTATPSTRKGQPGEPGCGCRWARREAGTGPAWKDTALPGPESLAHSSSSVFPFTRIPGLSLHLKSTEHFVVV